MKKYLIFLILPGYLAAQNLPVSTSQKQKSEIIQKLQNKTLLPDENSAIRKILMHKTATIEDAIVMSAISLGKYQPATGLKTLISVLRKNKVPIDGSYFSKKDRFISRGLSAKWIMSSLKLSGGIFYTLFKSERYSYQECVYKKIMADGFSSNSYLSGPALVSAFALAREVKSPVSYAPEPKNKSIVQSNQQNNTQKQVIKNNYQNNPKGK